MLYKQYFLALYHVHISAFQNEKDWEQFLEEFLLNWLVYWQNSTVIHTVSNEMISEIVFFLKKYKHKFGCMRWNGQPEGVLTTKIEI